MKTTNLIVSDLDFERIMHVIESLPKNGPYPNQLQKKLDEMAIVDPSSIPPDLVTMNTEVACKVKAMAAAFPKRLKLVYPSEASLDKGRVSILTPLGTALLGAKLGHPIKWQGHDGTTRAIQLDEVIYQPEANGHWHL